MRPSYKITFIFRSCSTPLLPVSLAPLLKYLVLTSEIPIAYGKSVFTVMETVNLMSQVTKY